MSRLIAFKVPPTLDTAIRFQEDHDTVFYDRFHSHPEIQFSYIVSSHGMASINYRAVGFVPGDLFVLGGMLPHVFRNDRPGPDAHALSILFLPSSLGHEFYALPEAKILSKLWEECKRGIKISQFEHLELLESFRQTRGLKRMILLFQLVEVVANHPNKELILPFVGSSTNPDDQVRMQTVFQYIAEHFQHPVKLEEVAAVAAMSSTAFCRYFKSRTRYSLINYLNAYRVEIASKRLTERDWPIAQIAESCGFRNQANFNRQFRAITGKTPQEYRKSLRNNSGVR